MIETKLEIPAIGVETLFFRPDGVADFRRVGARHESRKKYDRERGE